MGSRRMSQVERKVNPTCAHSLENLGDQINKITSGSLAWRLTWSIVAMMSWAIWNERNQRLKTGKYCSKEDVRERSISDTTIGFSEERYKKETIPIWTATIITLHDDENPATTLSAAAGS